MLILSATCPLPLSSSFYYPYLNVYATDDWSQRLGENDVKLSCNPLYKNGSQLLNPCGLIANSFFNGE